MVPSLVNSAEMRDRARFLDSSDPLYALRREFSIPTDDSGTTALYFCGHSLGAMPTAARAIVNQELDDWSTLGVRGHVTARRPWITYADALRNDLAHLVGAELHEVVLMNSLTINLHLMLASFFQPRRDRNLIVMEAGAFSSDRHAVVSQLQWHGFDPDRHLIELKPPTGEDLIRESTLEALLADQGDRISLILWPGVQFRTGQSFDLARITRAGHQAGAIVGLDLAHAVGNVPLALHDAGPDFAVWCSYKYLNGGPGAIGGCFVHSRHAERPTRARLAGWWGHDLATRFDMGPQFAAGHGASGFQVSNPPILSAAPLAASLEIFRQAGMNRLRQKSMSLTGFLEELLGHYAGDVDIVTPRDPQSRGAQLSLRIRGDGARGRQVFEWLSARGIVIDWRAPDILRVAPVPLYNGFDEVYRFAQALGQALASSR